MLSGAPTAQRGTARVLPPCDVPCTGFSRHLLGAAGVTVTLSSTSASSVPLLYASRGTLASSPIRLGSAMDGTTAPAVASVASGTLVFFFPSCSTSVARSAAASAAPLSSTTTTRSPSSVPPATPRSSTAPSFCGSTAPPCITRSDAALPDATTRT